MKIFILIEHFLNEDNSSVVNVFTDEVLANKYYESFKENQPDNFYFLREIDTTEEDIQDGNV